MDAVKTNLADIDKVENILGVVVERLGDTQSAN
jgi:hypothetical protein